MEKVKTSALAILSLAIIITAILGTYFVGKASIKQEIIHDTIYLYRELSEWELFTMATIEVESRYDPNSINIETGATGILQIMPIYVEEYNRISGNSLNHNSVFDPITSLMMWEVINDYYNPDRQFEKAVYIHNPKAGDWYRQRIFNKMDDIARYEAMRRNVVEICYGH